MPLENPQGANGPREPRSPRESPPCDGPPCDGDRHLFCDEAWAGIAEKLGLAPRQVEILRCALADQSDNEIAATLGLARGTVHTHMARLHGKLGTHNRLQLATRVFVAYRAWRIESPPPTGCPLSSRLA